jgi:hypothetical protein
MPVMIPLVPIVATLVVDEFQIPPELPLTKVVVPPVQIVVNPPEIELTVYTRVDMHPDIVYVTRTVPVVAPVGTLITPEESTTALEALLVLQEPPEGVQDNVIELPAHNTVASDDIGVGTLLTDTNLVAVQPEV